MADHDQQPRQGREIEEGEVVSGYHYNAAAGSDTDTDDEDARYYLQASYLHNGQWVKPSSASARRISPAASFGSDGTVSDAAAAAAPVDAPARFPCRVCPRDFGSSKAVHGHMKVHAQAAKHLAAVAAAMRASTGGRASAVEEMGDSVSTPVALPAMPDDTTTITPVQSVCSNNPVMNAASGSGNSSAGSSVEPSPTMASVVPAPPAAAPEQAPVVPLPPQQAPIAPPQQAPIAPLLHPLQPPVFDGPLQLAVRGDPGRGFSCRECGRWFPTHQGLGGHVAGHKNRRIAAAAAAAAAAGIDPQDHIACRGGARPPKTHACKICGAEYPTGVSLGGHMRKHYSGKPIVPRKRQRLGNELALALPLQMAHPPAMAVPIVAPPLAAAPAVPAGTVRIFGVNFVQQANP